MAAKQKKVIITCAATGSIHTPTMSPHLPLTPSEIAEQSIEAAEAGAAIIHLHARNPEDGSPTPSPDVFMEFLPRIKQSCKSVINITTGGGHGMTLEERLAGAMRTKPEMSSLNMGSMNFGLYPMLEQGFPALMATETGKRWKGLIEAGRRGRVGGEFARHR